MKSEELGVGRMWGRRLLEEWPSVVSAVLWWGLSALLAMPTPLNLNRDIFVCACVRHREKSIQKTHRLNSSSLYFLKFCLYTVYNSDHLALSNELAVQRNQCYSVYFPLIVNVSCIIHIDFCLCCQVPILLMGYHSGCVMEDSCYKMT